MNIEKYEGKLDQNHRFGIKFNSHIPTTHKWYAIINGNYLGINEGDSLVYNADGHLVTCLPENLQNYFTMKEA